MRPYLTIVRDSFHEALASRVLWMILIVITVVLLFIAPLGPKGLSGPELAATEVFDPPALAKAILKDNEDAAPSVGKRILEQLPADARTRIDKIAAEKDIGNGLAPTTPGSDADWLAAQLSTLIDRDDLFDETAWKKVRLRAEARKLQKEGVANLSGSEHARFQRLALEAAFPGKLAQLANREERLAYLGFNLEFIPAAKRSELQVAIGGLIFAMLKLGVGVAGILIGLFVTSTIVPQTFEAGAVDLLFSKPVVRSGVYLTKFLGGCSFVLIMATYFIGGIWLLAGVRFGLWNNPLLATIPIFVFIFAVYYSVSCLAGAYWRNPIVSVVMAVALWALGWVLVGVNTFAQARIIAPLRAIKVVEAGDTPITVSEMGIARRWEPTTKTWITVFAPEAVKSAGFGIEVPPAYAGPIYDAKRKRIVALERNVPEFRQFASAASIWVGDADTQFVRTLALALPPDAQDANGLLREPDGSFLIVTRGGLRRWDGEVQTQTEEEPPKIAGFEVPSILRRGKPDATVALPNVGPTLSLSPRYQVAINPESGELAILDEEGLYLCKRGEDGKYAVRTKAELELDKVGLLAFAGNTVLTALPDGELLAFNASDAMPREALHLPGEAGPNTMFAAPNGKSFAILTRDKYVYLYDPADHAVEEADVSGQGDVTAIAFSDQSELLVADRADRVTSYAMPQQERVSRYQAPRDWTRFAYEFLLYPVYRIVPKPYELDQLTLSLVSDLDQSQSMNIGRDTDLNAPQATSKWTPVRDNALFIAVMLALGCWHVARRDY